jgi:nicotinamidase/pyrazinamidase
VDYDKETALIVVDVQNDFADPNGALYVSGAEETLPVINGEIAKARDAGATVVFTQDWHPADTPHFEKDGGIWPVHCVGDTWGAEFHPFLAVENSDTKIQKGVGGEDGYSGFTVADPKTGETAPTGLDDLLKEKGIEKVVVVGLATDYCVKATAIDASNNSYETHVLAEAIRAVNLEAGDGAKAIEEMAAAGAQIID